MQGQDTAEGASAPSGTPERHVIVAAVNATAGIIAHAVEALRGALTGAGVEIVQVDAIAAGSAASVGVDAPQGEQTGELPPQVPGTAGATHSADNGADDRAGGSPAGDPSAGLTPSNAGDQHTSGAPTEQPAAEAGNGAPIANPGDGMGQILGGVVQPSGDGGTGSDVVGHISGSAGFPSVSADLAPMPAEITEALHAAAGALMVQGNPHAATILLYLAAEQARLETSEFNPDILRPALVAAVGALDQIGESAHGDVISGFGAALFPKSWKLPLVFDPPAQEPAVAPQAGTVNADLGIRPSVGDSLPNSPVVPPPADPSPPVDPKLTNPNAR